MDGQRAIVVRSDGHVLLLKTHGGQVLGMVQPFQRDTTDRQGIASVYSLGDDAIVLVGDERHAAYWDFSTGALTEVELTAPLTAQYGLRRFWHSTVQLVTVDVRRREFEGVAWAAPGVARGRWRFRVQDAVEDIQYIDARVAPDGHHLLVPSDDHEGWQLRRVDANVDISLADPALPFSHPSFDLAGRHIAALAGDREIKLWSVADGRLVRAVELGEALTDVRWARSGDSVYGFARDGLAAVVSVSFATGAVQPVDPASIFIDSAGYVIARPPSLETATEEIIAVSPDGAHVLLESDTALRFVRTSDGATVGVVPVLAPPDVTSSATWLPNTELLLQSATGSLRVGGGGTSPVPCSVDPESDWSTQMVAPHVAHTQPGATVSPDARFSIREGALCPLNEAARAYAGPLDLSTETNVEIFFTLASAGLSAGGDETTMRLYPLPRVDTSVELEMPPAVRCKGCDLRFLAVSANALVLTDGELLQVNDPVTGRRRFLVRKDGATPLDAEIAPDGGSIAVAWNSGDAGAYTWRVYGPSGEPLDEVAAEAGGAFYLSSTLFAVRGGSDLTLLDLTQRTRSRLDIRRADPQCDDADDEYCDDPSWEPFAEGRGATLLVSLPETDIEAGRVEAYLPPYQHVGYTMAEHAAVSPDGTRVYDCAAGRLRVTSLASLVHVDLGPCLHGKIVAGDDPRFVVVLAGSTVHVVRVDGARIELMSFEHEGRRVTVVREATTGQFELLGDRLLAARVGYRAEGHMLAGQVEDARSSRWDTPGLVQRFFSGAPLGRAMSR